MKIGVEYCLLLISLVRSFQASKKFGPVDILIIMDESQSMVSIDGHEHYKTMLNFVFDTFEIGMNENQSRISLTCTGTVYQVFQFVDSDHEKTFFEDRLCKLKPTNVNNSKYTDNLHENWLQVERRLSGRGIRAGVKKFVFVFTDGVLTLNETIITEDLKKIQQAGKVFFFHLNEPNGLSQETKTAIKAITQSEKRMIHFDVKNLENIAKLFRSAACENFNPLKKTCKSVPNEIEKCQQNLDELNVGGCFENPIEICDESMCDCDEMYPWPDAPTEPCTITCGGIGTAPFSREVKNTSKCKRTMSRNCYKDPCPNIAHEETELPDVMTELPAQLVTKSNKFFAPSLHLVLCIDVIILVVL